MNLLIDIGNSRLKWAVENTLNLDIGEPFYNIDITRTALILAWRQFEIPPERLAIACVASSRLLDLVLSVAYELWPSITIHRAESKIFEAGIRNAYREPEKLGVDRWLGMIAGFNLYRSAVCVVSCGTAVTIDLVDANGQHEGGLIAPGLRLMRNALIEGTENLTASDRPYPFEIAKCTDAAIYNGTLTAACGFVEHVLQHKNQAYQLLLTGGDAEIIAARLSNPAPIDSALVLRGLALTLEQQP